MKTPAPSRLTRGAAALAAFLALALPAAAAAEPPATPAPTADGWIPFEGSWSATGHRQDLVVGGREAATFHLSGSLAMTKGEGFRKGFRAEAIGFDDGVEAAEQLVFAVRSLVSRLSARLTGRRQPDADGSLLAA